MTTRTTTIDTTTTDTATDTITPTDTTTANVHLGTEPHEPQQQRRRIRDYVTVVRGRIIVLSLLLVVSKSLGVLNPVVVQHFINLATVKAPVMALLGLAGLFLIIAVSNQLLTVLLSYLGSDVAWRMTNQMRQDLLQHCLGLEMTFHNQRTAGEMIERVDGDVSAVSTFFSQFVINILGSFLLVAGILVVMFLSNWTAGLAMFVFTVVAAVVMLTIRNLGVQASVEERQTSAQLFGLIEERLSGIEDVQANGAVDYVMHRFYDSMRNYFHTGRRAWMLRVIPFNVVNVLYTIGVVMMMGIGVSEYLSGHLSLGLLYLFYQYTQMLADPLEALGNHIQDYQKAQSGLRRIRALLATQPSVVDGPGHALPAGPLSISFDHVSFGYTDEHVLHDLDLHLEAGQVLGIVGRTGSGKTSLSRLLLRLYDVKAGEVRLGGVDVRELTLAQLYARVGMVTQDVQLFDATVRDNMTLFSPDIEDDVLHETLSELGLSDWITRLPTGLDTHIRGGGASLSAGEAQLLALVRVFLTKPSLVILDEPSSRLDPLTESLLQKAVHRLLENCTGIIIAHRLATLSQVDQVLVLRDGQVLEYGDYDVLTRDDHSHFGRLLGAELQEELA